MHFFVKWKAIFLGSKDIATFTGLLKSIGSIFGANGVRRTLRGMVYLSPNRVYTINHSQGKRKVLGIN